MSNLSRVKVRLALSLLLLVLIWPVIHMLLSYNLGFSPWRFAGWGMYATPQATQVRMLLIVQGNPIPIDIESHPSIEREQLRKLIRAVKTFNLVNDIQTLGDLAHKLFSTIQQVERVVILRIEPRLDLIRQYTYNVVDIYVYEQERLRKIGRYDSRKLNNKVAALGPLGNSVGLQEGTWAQGCNMTLSPGSLIQSAINKASSGAVICLGKGTWNENIVINKSLSLRGIGRSQTFIKGAQAGKAVIRIESEQSIEVAVDGMTIAEAKQEDGLQIAGKAKVILINITISNHGDDGIYITDSAQAIIQNAQISGNGDNGILIRSSSSALIQNNTIQDNKACGIWSRSDQPIQGGNNQMHNNRAGDLCGPLPASLRIPLVSKTGRTQLTVPVDYKTLQEAIDALASGGVINVEAGTYIEGLTIYKNLVLRGKAGREQIIIRGGISICCEALQVGFQDLTIQESPANGILGSAIGMLKVSITGVKISNNDNWYGIWLRGSAQAMISDSTISSSRLQGIYMKDSARAIISSTTIDSNGTHPNCVKVELICRGILVADNAVLEVRDSHIINNTDWGLAAVLKKCGASEDLFTGKVVFQGLNTITGNNKSGNHNSMGNPGNHPFKNLPDGQVCLP